MTRARRHSLTLAWVVWAVAELCYIVAVFNRTSLAALGPAAQHHFSIDATTLSAFAVLQLVVYAAMQIPVGALLDRFGVTAMLLTGGVIMMIGQIVMATAEHVWVAIAARMLLGIGDACTFISTIRLLADWFPLRMLPIMGQVTGMIGYSGQILSVFPLPLAVGAFGWTAGFTGIAAVGAIVLIIGFVTLRDRPGRGTAWERLTGRMGKITVNSVELLNDRTIGLAAMPANTEAIVVPGPSEGSSTNAKPVGRLRTVIRLPGVRLAFWVHFTAPFPQHVLLLLWGTPFLVSGIGLSASHSAWILSYMVLVGGIAGLTFGQLTSRFIQHRVHIVLATVVAMMLAWFAVIFTPGIPPIWLIYLMVTLVATGGAASMIAFEVSRSYAPRRMLGLASGAVNMGGFIAALIMILLLGLTLDLLGAGEPETYRLDAFKIAFAVQAVLWILGISMILIERGHTKRWLAERGRTI